jgi:hypothetical protein
MRGLAAASAGVDGWLERVSGQHPPSVPREGQADQWSWTSLLAGLAGVAHWYGDQANGEKTGRGDYAMDSGVRLLSQAEQLLQDSRGGTVLNTAFIERLNGTFRERLASLTRKSRHAARRLRALETGMYLIGCTYNFCFPHHELSKTTHIGSPCPPAMAAGLTDHIWSLCELLRYRISPPALD